MKKTLRYITFNVVAFAIVCASFVSCNDTLQVDPRQSIDAELALRSEEGLRSAINSIYARLRSTGSYGSDYIIIPEVLADNGYATQNRGGFIANWTNNPGANMGGWQNNYYAINETNLILRQLDEGGITPNPTETQVNTWIGELKFLRALYHFDLVRIYAYAPTAIVPALNQGGVPIAQTGIRTLVEAQETLPGRAPINDVYNFIIADLQDAISRLTDNPRPGQPAVHYANRTAANALLSRVALYAGNYALSASSATAALAGSVGTLTTGNAYIAGWRSSVNPESIFEVRFFDASENIGVNVSLHTTFNTLVALGNPTSVGGWGDVAPTMGLLAELGVSRNGTTTIRGADIRGQLFEVGPGRGSGPKLENTKFIGKNGPANLDNVPVIRKSEMVLNRAEAYSTIGSPVYNPAAALADLNTIRVGRGLDAVNLSGTALYEEVIRQRRLEFAFEGHRFFDLKRLGRDIIKSPGQGNVNAPPNVGFTEFRILPAIPQRELDGNPNLVQNSGY